jgi:hypothetical protein
MAFGPALRPHLLLIQLIPWDISWMVMRLGREADHSPPSIIEVKNGGAIPLLSDMSSRIDA